MLKKMSILILTALTSIGLSVFGQQQPDSLIEPMATGKFAPTWESLSQYEVPEWYRDVKFGIWAHWGPQCQPEQGDWFARSMYEEGSHDYNWFREHYGPQSQFGFKDICNDWKAQHWDPDRLVSLYKRCGAQYFFAMGNHHDNFDLWNSKYQPWNSVNIGPKRDILDGWAKAARKNGLYFGVSIHAAHAWTWYETAQRSDKEGLYAGIPYDGKLTKADGKGTWWAGLDPQDLYEQNHELSRNSDNSGSIHGQWNWDVNAGPSIPSKAYCDKFYNRTVDMINHYKPDLIYFDDTALPLWPVSDVGLRIAAHYYNTSMQEHNGNVNNVIFGKILTEDQRKCMVWDVEKGAFDKIQNSPWQTCSCIGNWHYDRSLYDNDRYKPASEVIRMLIDVVSKNGNLLLNIPVRGDGTIDDKEEKVLNDIAAWMDINKESIFGTRPWVIFGEGPVAETSNPLKAQGFNEGIYKKLSSQDIRFTTKGSILYAHIMQCPEKDTILVKSLGKKSPYFKGHINAVTLLGAGKIPYKQTSDGLLVTLPPERPNPVTLTLKIATR